MRSVDLRQCRAVLGWPENVLADVLDVSVDTYVAWELGVEPIPPGVRQQLRGVVDQQIQRLQNLLVLDLAD